MDSNKKLHLQVDDVSYWKIYARRYENSLYIGLVHRTTTQTKNAQKVRDLSLSFTSINKYQYKKKITPKKILLIQQEIDYKSVVIKLQILTGRHILTVTMSTEFLRYM